MSSYNEYISNDKSDECSTLLMSDSASAVDSPGLSVRGSYTVHNGPSLAHISQCLLIAYRWLNHFTLALHQRSNSKMTVNFVCLQSLAKYDEDDSRCSHTNLTNSPLSNDIGDCSDSEHTAICSYLATLRYVNSLTDIYRTVQESNPDIPASQNLFVPSLSVFNNCLNSIRVLEEWYRDAYAVVCGASRPVSATDGGNSDLSSPSHYIRPSLPLLDRTTPWGEGVWLATDLVGASVLCRELRDEIGYLEELILDNSNNDYEHCSFAERVSGCGRCGIDEYMIGVYKLTDRDKVGGYYNQIAEENKRLREEMNELASNNRLLSKELARCGNLLEIRHKEAYNNKYTRYRHIARVKGLIVENFNLRKTVTSYEHLLKRLRCFVIDKNKEKQLDSSRLIGEFDSIVNHADEFKHKILTQGKGKKIRTTLITTSTSTSDVKEGDRGSRELKRGSYMTQNSDVTDVSDTELFECISARHRIMGTEKDDKRCSHVTPHFTWDAENAYDKQHEKYLLNRTLLVEDELSPDRDNGALLALIKWYKYNDGLLCHATDEQAKFIKKLLEILLYICVVLYNEASHERIHKATKWKRRSRASIPDWYHQERAQIVQSYQSMISRVAGDGSGYGDGIDQLLLEIPNVNPTTKASSITSVFSRIWFCISTKLNNNGTELQHSWISKRPTTPSIITPSNNTRPDRDSSRYRMSSDIIVEPHLVDWKYTTYTNISAEGKVVRPDHEPAPLFWTPPGVDPVCSCTRQLPQTCFSIGGGGFSKAGWSTRETD